MFNLAPRSSIGMSPANLVRARSAKTARLSAVRLDPDECDLDEVSLADDDRVPSTRQEVQMVNGKLSILLDFYGTIPIMSEDQMNAVVTEVAQDVENDRRMQMVLTDQAIGQKVLEALERLARVLNLWTFIEPDGQSIPKLDMYDEFVNEDDVGVEHGVGEDDATQMSMLRTLTQECEDSIVELELERGAITMRMESGESDGLVENGAKRLETNRHRESVKVTERVTTLAGVQWSESTKALRNCKNQYVAVRSVIRKFVVHYPFLCTTLSTVHATTSGTLNLMKECDLRVVFGVMANQFKDASQDAVTDRLRVVMADRTSLDKLYETMMEVVKLKKQLLFVLAGSPEEVKQREVEIRLTQLENILVEASCEDALALSAEGHLKTSLYEGRVKTSSLYNLRTFMRSIATGDFTSKKNACGDLIIFTRAALQEHFVNGVRPFYQYANTLCAQFQCQFPPSFYTVYRGVPINWSGDEETYTHEEILPMSTSFSLDFVKKWANDKEEKHDILEIHLPLHYPVLFLAYPINANYVHPNKPIQKKGGIIYPIELQINAEQSEVTVMPSTFTLRRNEFREVEGIRIFPVTPELITLDDVWAKYEVALNEATE